MDTSRRFQGRRFLIVAIAVTALVIGAAAAVGQSAPDTPTNGSGSDGSTGTAVSGVAVAGTTVATPGVVSSGITAPAWCCGTGGEVPGLTAYGQAVVDGQGTDARDAAIAKAVNDATDQANAAAAAAGITLGPIVDLQISAIPVLYPMMGTAAGSSPGSAGTGAEPQPMPYQSTVSVTITWSLG